MSDYVSKLYTFVDEGHNILNKGGIKQPKTHEQVVYLDVEVGIRWNDMVVYIESTMGIREHGPIHHEASTLGFSRKFFDLLDYYSGLFQKNSLTC